MSNPKFNDTAKDQAAAQASSIVDMLAAVNCDYERMEELKEELDSLTEDVLHANEAYNTSINEESSLPVDEAQQAVEEAQQAHAQWVKDYSEELQNLKNEAGECENEEQARERIQEDPLEVQVRSDWTSPSEELTASEFMILLCTGGPAVRIVGELSEHGEPERAWLEYQDWGTPWTRFYDVESDTLVEYASHFYFGG